MKKLYIAIIIILVIFLGLAYFSVVGIQTVSTDKKVYFSGEEVRIYWSDFNLKRCTNINKEISILKQETTGWERVLYKSYQLGPSYVCINGKIFGSPMVFDVVSVCSFPRLNFESGDFLWKSKIYERKGTVNSCLNPLDNKVINKTMQSYELKNAPPGKYKIIFGNAQEIIEIK
jgi:hypothetical protein